jgi:predicted TIM-barrel fold metal-dependent hydrolase
MADRVVDFNIHLPIMEASRDRWLATEAVQTPGGFRSAYAGIQRELRSVLSGANFMLFNQDLPFADSDLGGWTASVRQDWRYCCFTQLFDFRRKNDLDSGLSRLLAAGVNGVKFHSYVQEISRADIPLAVQAARAAASLGFFICIDASYGTSRMYEFDNLLLAAEIINVVSSVPIIILHSGGARCWDAMLLSVGTPNVYLETSFSLPFYEGSSIEDDFAYIYRKIGCDRVLFASDLPYVGLSDALECANRFFERHGFAEDERQAILGGNAARLISDSVTA